MNHNLMNDLTLNFLISKQQLEKLNKKIKHISDESNSKKMNEYQDRIRMLFDNLLVHQPPDDLLLEVKSAFDIFINKSISYFELQDSNSNEEEDAIIKDDIDYEKEERDVENGNYEENSDSDKIVTKSFEQTNIPIDWFQRIRQNQNSNQIVPRKINN